MLHECKGQEVKKPATLVPYPSNGRHTRHRPTFLHLGRSLHRRGHGLRVLRGCGAPAGSRAHQHHLQALHSTAQGRVFGLEPLVAALQLQDIFGGFAEDSGFVELSGTTNEGGVVVKAKAVVEVLVELTADVATLLEHLGTLGHHTQSRDGITQLGNFVIEVGAVALLDHVVSRLLWAQGRWVLGLRRRSPALGSR